MVGKSTIGRTEAITVHRGLLRWWVLFAALPYVGASPLLAQPAVSDSAGVRVITNPSSLPADARAWTLSSEPALEIGVTSGPPEYTFYFANGGAVLGDGAIVIADLGSNEVRIYEPDGSHRLSFGRAGSGPGEFSRPDRIGVFGGDSLAVISRLEYGARRVSVFDKEGNFDRWFTVEAAGRVAARLVRGSGILANGNVVAWTRGDYQAAPESGSWRSTEQIHLLNRSGEVESYIGAFPAVESWVQRPSPAGFSAFTTPFTRRLHVSAVGNRLAVANDDAFSIRIYDESGRILYVVRQRREFERAREPLARWIGERVARSSDPARMRDIYQRMPVPETVPAFASILLDLEGHLWVEEYRMPWDEDAASTWQVFDPEGILRAVVTLPPRFRVMEIGRDHVLGVWRDALEVERVRLYRLGRGEDAR